MASMKEIAIGVAQVLLQSREPEPLYVDLWNESPEEAAELVKRVLAECADGDVPLSLIRVPDNCWAALAGDAQRLIRPKAARIEAVAVLRDRVEFWRREPADPDV